MYTGTLVPSRLTPTMIRTIVFLGLLHLCLSGDSLPTTFKRCHWSSPDFNVCMREATQNAVDQMCDVGIPSLGVRPLDPLSVTEARIEHGGRGPVSVKLLLKNAELRGNRVSTVKSFDVSMDRYEIVGHTAAPLYTIQSDYVLDGKLLVFPVKGKGRCNITFDDVTTVHTIISKPVVRDGETYWQIQTYDLKMTAKKMHLHFENLFNGDKTLGQTMNAVLNEHWELIYEELKPSFEKAFEGVFLEIAKSIFDKVPIDEIILP